MRPIDKEYRMRRMLTFIAALVAGLGLLVSVAAAQAPSDAMANKADPLSLEQKIRISRLITKQTPPLTGSAFSIAVGVVVPPQVEVHALPAEAAQVAPQQLRDAGYVVVEELIALVDQRTRKIELVFPRWQ
jgi:hypothetical protein